MQQAINSFLDQSDKWLFAVTELLDWPASRSSACQWDWAEEWSFWHLHIYWRILAVDNDSCSLHRQQAHQRHSSVILPWDGPPQLESWQWRLFAAHLQKRWLSWQSWARRDWEWSILEGKSLVQEVHGAVEEKIKQREKKIRWCLTRQ